MVSFCVMADTLYLLKVNCNKCILEGSLKPPERYLKITEKGMLSLYITLKNNLIVTIECYCSILTFLVPVCIYLHVGQGSIWPKKYAFCYSGPNTPACVFSFSDENILHLNQFSVTHLCGTHHHDDKIIKLDSPIFFYSNHPPPWIFVVLATCWKPIRCSYNYN